MKTPPMLMTDRVVWVVAVGLLVALAVGIGFVKWTGEQAENTQGE